jgi:hypothetical protein
MSVSLTQVADPLVPNRIWEFLENLKTRVLGKGFGMRELQESLSGADLENWKMRRLGDYCPAISPLNPDRSFL